jgi:hypothetical protein
VRSRPWSREQAIAEVRRDIWRYLKHTASREPELQLEAAAILQMPAAEVRTLAQAQFILGEDVRALLDGMGGLMRRLATTTVDEEECSAEHVRGPIQWGPTLMEQSKTGLRHRYVTAPAKRAFDTPENRILVAALVAIVDVGERTGWHRLGERHLAGEVRARVDEARHWRSRRALSSILVTNPTPRALSRLASGRTRRRYRPAVEVVRTHQRLVRRLDRDAIRTAVERHALVTSSDDVLLELLCAFAIARALTDSGWVVSHPGLVRHGRCFLTASRGHVRLELHYQGVPARLAAGAAYDEVQKAHGFPGDGIGRLRPDFVIRLHDDDGERWILGEVKGGPRRRVQDSARDALYDLLAYRRNYDGQLAGSTGPHGFGIAWGAELEPAAGSEVVLCTPDRLGQALDALLAGSKWAG